MTRKNESMFRSVEQRRESRKSCLALRRPQHRAPVAMKMVCVEKSDDISMRSHPIASSNTKAKENTPQAGDAANASAATSEPSHTVDKTAEDSTRATNDQHENAPQPKDTAEATRPSSSHEDGRATKTVSTTEDTQENATTTQDDQDDHIIVEGEEDTVIY